MKGTIQKILPYEKCIVLWNECIETKEYFGDLELLI
jgi:hypothetical protein